MILGAETLALLTLYIKENLKENETIYICVCVITFQK